MSESLRQAVNELTADDKVKLIYALNNGIAKWVNLKENRFIGVHVCPQNNMTIEAVYNSWTYGVFNE